MSFEDDFQSILLSLSTLMFIKANKVLLEGMLISVILNFEFTALWNGDILYKDVLHETKKQNASKLLRVHSTDWKSSLGAVDIL